MSRREIVRLTCDRCFTERTATQTLTFCYGGVQYEVDLCDEHAERFESDMLAWVRLGRESDVQHGAPEQAPKWVPGARYAAKPELVVFNTRGMAEEIEPVKPYVAPLLPPTPGDRNEWTFTDHAEQRMIERELTRSDVLAAAAMPHTRRPGREPELTVHERDGVKAVVNVRRMVIVTAARVDREEASI